MLDDYEKRILSALQKDARASVSELSRVLGLSRSTVQSKIDRLESKQVIKGYSVQLGEGYRESLVCAYVMIKCQQRLTGHVNNALIKFDTIYELNALSGEYDLMAIVKCESLKELNTVLDKIANLDGIERTNSSIVLENKLFR